MISGGPTHRTLCALALCALAHCAAPASPADAFDPDAPDATDATSPFPDATAARTPVPLTSPECGAFEQLCCPDGPPCERGLACGFITLAEAPPRCVAYRTPHCFAEGIADPTFARADFPTRPRSPSCGAPLPEELRRPQTVGTFGSGHQRIGYLACQGFRPGRATLSFRARIRLVEPNCLLDETRCCCGSPGNYRMGITPSPGPAYSLTGRGPEPGLYACTDGPDIDWEQPVLIADDGRFTARIDLYECERAGYTNCLFLRGTQLTLTQ